MFVKEGDWHKVAKLSATAVAAHWLLAADGYFAEKFAKPNDSNLGQLLYVLAFDVIQPQPSIRFDKG